MSRDAVAGIRRDAFQVHADQIQLQPESGEILPHRIVEEFGDHGALELLRLEGAQHGVAQFLFGRGPRRDLPRDASGEAGLAVDAERKDGDVPGALGPALAQQHGLALRVRERRAPETWNITVFPIRVEGTIRYAGGLAREITAWASAEQELRHTVLGALKAQEFERTMVSKFLHDSVGQNLTALGLQLDLVRMDLEPISPAICQNVADIQKMLGEMMESVRDYSYELNPVHRGAGRLAARAGPPGRPPAAALHRAPCGQRGSLAEARSQDCRARSIRFCRKPSKTRATFRLLGDRNRGKVHTYRVQFWKYATMGAASIPAILYPDAGGWAF